MATLLTDKIKQKNNGEFFLVDATDVDVTSGADESNYPSTSLDAFLKAIPADNVVCGDDGATLTATLADIRGLFSTDADTVDGMHAADLASAEDLNALKSLVGSVAVADQISTAIANIDGLDSTKIVHGADLLLLSYIIETYILNVDYSVLAFDTTEIVDGEATSSGASSLLGTGVLGQMILG